MTVSVFDECTSSCGWIAAIVAVASFGSFGVPIKLLGNVESHPFIMQSYKTLVCFITCWLVVLLGEEIRFSPWGIASGLFWVPGATCGIYAIQYAGLAISVGTWSTIIVFSSTFIGIVMFNESFKNLFETFLAFSCLVCGLIGMSIYSSPQPKVDTVRNDNNTRTDDDNDDSILSTSARSVGTNSPRLTRKQKLGRHPSFLNTITPTTTMTTVHDNTGSGPDTSQIHSLEIDSKDDDVESDNDMNPLLSVSSFERALSTTNLDNNDEKEESSQEKNQVILGKQYVILFGGRLSLTRRQLGIAGAVINGSWGGMNLVPLHFAMQSGISGAGYVISYATGALIVNTFMWIALFLYYLLYKTKDRDVKEALVLLPRWRIDQIIPGIGCGLLYSCGNFTSMLAVVYLGQGMGYSIVQMNLFVSGLWGIFYFHEIRGNESIVKWFLSATIAFIGIIGVSYEHQSSSSSTH